jgi:hypothetical protein
VSGGQWVERELSWHDTEVVNCPVCGRLITRRTWRFKAGEGTLAVCSPECEELYETYWKPTHGAMHGDANH